MAPQGPSAGPSAGPPEAKRPRWDAGLEAAELGRAKAELAAAFRVLAGCKLNEGIFNHLSCRVPGRKDLFMTNRCGAGGATRRSRRQPSSETMHRSRDLKHPTRL